MAIKILDAASISANYHVHFRTGTIPTSVSAGYANERTFFIKESRRDVPIQSRDTRITVDGTFGSGSASTTLAVDIGPNGSAYVNLFSISAPFTSVIPIHPGDVLRLRYAWSSAAAAITNASVNCWLS